MRFSFLVTLLLAIGAPALGAEQKFEPEIYALQLLNQQKYVIASPIQVVDSAEAIRLLAAQGADARLAFENKSAMPRAFRVRRVDGSLVKTIYVVKDSEAYQMSARGHNQALLLLASSILHENAHDQDAGEEGPRNLEADFLAKQLMRVSEQERPYLAQTIAAIRRLAKESPQVASR